MGAGGTQPAVIQEIDVLRMGDLVLKEVPIEFVDLDNPFGIEFILGSDLLDFHRVKIDFESRQLGLRAN